MASFYFLEFEQEIFWRYLSRLNEFHAQCVDYCFEKWKICQVIFEGLNDECKGYAETMCPGVWIAFSQGLLMRFEVSLKS